MSKEILTQLLGMPIDDYVFVGGICDRQSIAAVLGAGYKRVYTTRWGMIGASEIRSRVLNRNALIQGMSDKNFMQLISAENKDARQALYMLKRLATRYLPTSAYNRLQRLYCSLQGKNKPGVAP